MSESIAVAIVNQAAEALPFEQRKRFKRALENLLAKAQLEFEEKLNEWQKQTPAHLRNLLEEVAAKNKCTATEIVNGPRTKDFVNMRRDFCTQAYARGYSLPVIGRAISRHHTSVLHLVRQAKKAEKA